MRRLILTFLFAPFAVAAQVPVDSVPPVSTHRLPITPGATLLTGRWSYAVSALRMPGAASPDSALTADTAAHPLGAREVSVGVGSYGGRDAWMIVASGGRGTLASVDTLWLDRETLRARRWTSALGLGRLVAELPGDTLFGATSAPASRQNMIAATPPDLIVSGEMLIAVLQALPLADGFADSAHTLGVDLASFRVAPATIAVTGAERIAVPAGAFDTWVVSLRGEGGEQRLWVTVDGRLLVRSEHVVPPRGPRDRGMVVRQELATLPVAP